MAIRGFKDGRLRRLHKRDDARGVPQEYAKRIALLLADLDDALDLKDIAAPGRRLHPLKGDMAGYWSVRVSANLRVVFRFEN